MAEMILGLPKEELFCSGHTSCSGCGPALAMRYALKAAGKNTVVVHATGCMEVVSSAYPMSAWKVPWIHGTFENVPAIASGIERAFKSKGKKVNILAIGGDGATFDIGLGALSGMIERGHKVCYICYDNEAYMNCLSLSTDILTKDGLKKITDIKKGDMIYAFNQKTYELILKKCTGIFDNGKKGVFEIRTLHHTIKATENHPFLTVQKNGRGKENNFTWKIVSELKKGDQIIVLKNLEGKSFSFKSIKKTAKSDYKVNNLSEVKLPSESSDDLMEFCGLFLGDGWIRLKKGEVGFALPENKYARNRLLMLQERLFGLRPSMDKNYIYFHSVNLTKFIDSLGFNLPAKKKTVPSWVFTLPASEKEAFIQGLMLSDGYKIGNSNRVVSASFELLKRISLLLQTIGYRVGKIHKQTKKKGTFVVYRKLLKDSTYGAVVFSERKDWNIEKYKSQYKYHNFLIGNKSFEAEKIQGIKSVGIEPTLDLRVEGEHNFIADGIVVHNTGKQRSSASPLLANTTTTPFGKKIHGKLEPKKPLPFIVAAHGIKYVATASIANPQDFYNKVKKGLAIDGPSFIHVFSPCQFGWKFPTDKTIEITEQAIKSCVAPIYEIENGFLKLNKVDNKIKIDDYLNMQGRYKHLNKEEISQLQQFVDDRWKFLTELETKGKVFDVVQ